MLVLHTYIKELISELRVNVMELVQVLQRENWFTIMYHYKITIILKDLLLCSITTQLITYPSQSLILGVLHFPQI